MPPDSSQDLHGSAPDTAHTCLLIIDMINEFAFEGADHMFPAIHATAERIAALKRRVKSAGFPVVYVNDNFGKWRSDFKRLVARCLEEPCRGKEITQLVHPDEDDYFVLKPKHSGFYATPLELLLSVVKADRLILTGIAGNSCILYTAADAYMRDFKLVVPSDCTLSNTRQENDEALEHMKTMLKAETHASHELRLDVNR